MKATEILIQNHPIEFAPELVRAGDAPATADITIMDEEPIRIAINSRQGRNVVFMQIEVVDDRVVLNLFNQGCKHEPDMIVPLCEV
jgi:hypothetical protein